MLVRGSPEDAGLDPDRLDSAYRRLQGWAEDGSVSGSALAVARNGILVEPRGFGRRRALADVELMRPDAVFLVASVTKPVTAVAVLVLIERGFLSLSDRVGDVIPEFCGPGRDEVRIIHLLTHTSGLPDMLPENEELRQRHADLSTFVRHICECEMLFEPGSQVRYQSMGTALAGEVVERLDGRSLRQFAAEEIFTPAGMSSTALGLDERLAGRLADVDIPPYQQGTNWHWNTEYWRSLGAPWGGMFSTVGDLLALLQCFLDGGACEGGRLLGRSTAAAMVRDQTARLGTLPPSHPDRWGLGWRLGNWGDLASPASFSHGGATGTLVGADPETGLACAIFTTQPGAPLHYVASAVQAAVV